MGLAPWTHEEQLERARIRLEWRQNTVCDPDCGVCLGGIKAARREYEALLAGGSE